MDNVWKTLADGGDMRSVIEVNGDGETGLYLNSEFRKLGVETGEKVVVVADEDERTITIDVGPTDPHTV